MRKVMLVVSVLGLSVSAMPETEEVEWKCVTDFECAQEEITKRQEKKL